jgi:hypothetical protein
MIKIYHLKVLKNPVFFLSLILLFVLFPQKYAISQGAGNCLDFGGTDEYVTFGSASELQISGDLTLECWVNIPSAPSIAYGLITYGANGETEPANQLYTLRLAYNAGNYRYQIAHEYGDEASPGDVVFTSQITPVYGQWVHIAVTRNTSTRTYRFYINGILDGQTLQYNSGQEPTGGTSAVAILGALFASSGSGTTPSSYFLVGKMDEVRIWNTIRTQAQIQAYMCRKLAGSETGLQGYWRLDESSGTSASDLTGNNNGTLTNMENGDWVTSGAPIGDVSTYLYVGNWTGRTVPLAHPDGDDMTVSAVTGSPTCVHVYYVNEAPNVTTPPATWNNIDPLRYWGVFVPGGTSPTYTVQYNYDGHPGIVTESTLAFATRAGGDATSWTDLGVSPNTTNHTLTSTGQTGIIPQYILGSTNGDNPLPVELASFTANLVSNGIQLQWTTFSEIENDGFEIWRSIDNDQNFEYLTGYQNNPLLVGAGNSSTTHEYGYLDNDIQNGHTYYYQLWDVSFGGERVSHAPVSVTLNQVPDAARKFVLFQNYPNPFNPITYIRFQINDIKSSYGAAIPVTLNIYDLLGRKIKTLLNEDLNVGDYTLSWDGTNEFNQNVASGSYIYMLQIGDQKITKQLVLVR